MAEKVTVWVANPAKRAKAPKKRKSKRAPAKKRAARANPKRRASAAEKEKPMAAKRRRKRKKTGGGTSTAAAAPKRRRKRKANPGNPTHHRAKAAPKHKRRRGRARRRNPSSPMVATLMGAVVGGVVTCVAGALVVRYVANPMARVGILGAGAVGASLLAKKHPIMATGVAAGLMAPVVANFIGSPIENALAGSSPTLPASLTGLETWRPQMQGVTAETMQGIEAETMAGMAGGQYGNLIPNYDYEA